MSEEERPTFPQRAVVTAGMPYGNKGLHFGHIAGVFVPADALARFLRDRIGSQNVLFVSGTDCYGSPINEGYRKLVESGAFQGTIEDYVSRNHEAQAAALRDYDISLDMFEGSGLGTCKAQHAQETDAFIRRLYDNGFLEYRESAQFYDPQAGTFLNGRQVVGRCPVQGCKSEHAYADECDLGHQYMPEDLIAPKSTLTGQTPEMRPVGNWYFKLPEFRELVAAYADDADARACARPVVGNTIREFLVPPVLFVQEKFRDAYEACKAQLPPHELREPEKGKVSFELEFADIEARDAARDVLAANGVQHRAGKALVPFRITGNIEWGVPAPHLADEDPLTVWCWPESLWAPISFTKAALEARGHAAEEYRDWWSSPDAQVYQFIGQDNIYFYGVAQPALWAATQRGHAPAEAALPGELQQTTLVANHHVLFMNKKASSSGAVKPPMAEELLEHYSAEQLRAHFLALALDQKSVSFSPKAYDPQAQAVRDKDPVAYEKLPDPVLKDGMVFTNNLNRMVRGAFYAAQRAAGVTLPDAQTGEAGNGVQSYIPLGQPSEQLVRRARKALLDLERRMYHVEIHAALVVVDEYLREASKYYNRECSAPKGEDATAQQLVDAFFLVRVSALLAHAVAPRGAEAICDYLCMDPERFFSWDGLLDGGGVAGIEALCPVDERAAGRHAVRTLPQRTDFFEKHDSQY